MAVESQALIHWRDVRRFVILAGGYAALPLVPRRLDRWCVEQLVAAFLRWNSKAVNLVAARMERRLGSLLPALTAEDYRRLAREHHRMRIEDMWGRLRGLHRLGWRPRIRVTGIERLREALEGGGAIVWTMTFSSLTAVKLGLYREGIPLTHLSRREHGSISTSRFGIAVNAPFYRLAEDQYLAERIIIPLDRSLGYMKRLRECLEQGACASIMGEHASRQSIRAPFLESSEEFATGAPALAASTGAALLPARAIRKGFEDYEVVIDEEIGVDRSLPRKEFVREAIGEFSRRLQAAILEKPQDWQGWLVRERQGAAGCAESANRK